jgi:hypothetical protein
MNDDMQCRFVFTDEDVDAMTDMLQEANAVDVNQIKQRGMTGIEVILVAVLATRAVAEIVERVSRLWKCGVIIDTRGSRVVTEKNCDLPRGDVLIIRADDDRVTVHEPTKLDIAAILNAVHNLPSS